MLTVIINHGAHQLQGDTAGSLIAVIQNAVDRKRMSKVLVADWTKLLSDSGSGWRLDTPHRKRPWAQNRTPKRDRLAP